MNIPPIQRRPTAAGSADRTLQRLRAAKAGNGEAYDALFAGSVDRLQLFLRVRLGNGLRRFEESVDLLQETYLAAHQAFADFSVPASGDAGRAFFGWLCAIAENCIRQRADHHGAKKRRAPSNAAAQRCSRVFESIAAGTLGPATRAERLDERHRIASAMLALDEDPRELLLLRHFEGLGYGEIARRTKRSESSARRDVAAALQLLGKQLAPGQQEMSP